MVDLSAATQHLVLGGRTHPLPSDSLAMELLAEGVVHADYGDPGHVFRITITQVPRVSVSFTPVILGEVEVDGVATVQVELVEVVLGNHVSVVLHGRGLAAERAAQQVE